MPRKFELTAGINQLLSTYSVCLRDSAGIQLGLRPAFAYAVFKEASLRTSMAQAKILLCEGPRLETLVACERWRLFSTRCQGRH